MLGKGGRQIKAVGQAAREELEQMLEPRVHLFLFVKVRPEVARGPGALPRSSGIGVPRLTPMLWQDEGVVLAVRRHGESAAVVSVFTRAAMAATPGWCAAAPAAGRAGLRSPATALQVTWRARLAEQLGSFTRRAGSGAVAARAARPARSPGGLGAACALLEATLPERDPHPDLYRRVGRA